MPQRTWTAAGYEVFTGPAKDTRFYLVICKEGDEEDEGSIFSNLDRKNPLMTYDEVVMILKQYNIPCPPTLYEDLMEDCKKQDDLATHDYGHVRSPSRIDVGTIGPRPCEIVLNRILIEQRDKKLTNKVMGLHLEFREGLKHLSDIRDTAWRKRMLALWRERCLAKLDSLGLPKVVHSHLGCALTANWRDYMKQHGLIPADHMKRKGQDGVPRLHVDVPDVQEDVQED